MIVKEPHFIPKSAHTYAVFFKGSGNPADDHEIVGVAFYDIDGELILGVGRIECDRVDDIYVRGYLVRK